MPLHIKLIARFGNGFSCLLWLLALFGSMGKGRPGGVFFAIGLLALSLFNIYVIEKCIRYFSQEAAA